MDFESCEQHVNHLFIDILKMNFTCDTSVVAREIDGYDMLQ